MPASADAFSAAGGAVSDLFGGLGQLSAAKGYKKAAKLAGENAIIAQQSADIQRVQTEREVYKALGGIQADVGGAGLVMGGSALDIIRASAQQGALAENLVSMQGAINVKGYQQEAASYSAMAKASKASGIGGIIGGALKVAGAVAMFSDEALKEDIRFVRRTDAGINIYTWRFKGQPTTFEGVLAQEIAHVRPDAVERDADGYLMVNYAALGIEPRIIA